LLPNIQKSIFLLHIYILKSAAAASSYVNSAVKIAVVFYWLLFLYRGLAAPP